MTKKSWIVLVCALIVLIAVAGCGSAPATPTKPVPTTAPQVVTVVITATNPPPTATTTAPTITPIPTLALTTTVPVTTPVTAKATATRGTPRATATKKPVTPTVAAATTAATAVPLKFAAPTLLEPRWVEGQKDERHFPGDALIFKWNSVGGLNGDECYSVRVDMVPVSASVVSRGDSFLVRCGDQTPKDYAVTFTLNQPHQGGPNYGSLLPDTQEIWVYWTVTVVKDLGLKAGTQQHNTTPLSPASSKAQFLLKGS
jgi:hypothetical protein